MGATAGREAARLERGTVAELVVGPVVVDERRGGGVLHDDPPFLLQMLRGRLYLRLAAPELSPMLLDGINSLFALAASRARADLTAIAPPADAPASGWHSSTPTAWQSVSGLHPSAEAPPPPRDKGR